MFSEDATKFEKIFGVLLTSVMFCAHNSVLVKKSTKSFQNKHGQAILYKLYASDGGSNPITEIQFVANVLRDKMGIIIFDL